jgi:glyoxylase-like metal-dependent hydrolase (beta-lactamase superfamily II)
MEFPGRRVYVHETELEAPYAGMWSGLMDTVEVVRLSGQEGEFEPGVRWMLTPGHADGLITLLVDTDDGLVAIPSDCVGPLPEYFDNMDLPQDFPEREILLEQWKKIRDLSPVLVIPGHYPPFTP